MKTSTGMLVVGLVFLAAFSALQSKPPQESDVAEQSTATGSLEANVQAAVGGSEQQPETTTDTQKQEEVTPETTPVSEIDEEYNDLFKKYDEYRAEFESFESQNSTSSGS